ncbi:MAG: SusD/RagB family nutrient-binding outer membrane lipoprotein [Prolixibacteraceae bacterium]|nr:SusD/RagB family nutrient-binding outer membrane lipoprotein [Prolixibacteraceae bacterium]
MKKFIPIIALITLLLSSCEGWLDINTDPNNPSKIKINKVLPIINQDIGAIMGNGYYDLGYMTSVFTHQLVTREKIDQYGIDGNDMDNIWASLYVGPLKEVENLINNATESDNMVYAGIGKFYKAFLYSQMVDMWGNVPFTEACTPGNFNAKFDVDKDIYTACLGLIDQAIADMTNTESENLLVPGADDIIYAGDTDKWIKAANSLKLKLYVQAMNTDLYDQAKVNALLAGDLIGEGEDFSVPYGPSVAPDDRNPGFVDEYAGGQISSYISPWFWEIINGKAAHILNGNPDPRVPYYICTQLGDGESPENPSEYRDGNFVTIYFGSVGVNSDHAGRNTFAMIGLYPVGGAYDSADLDKSLGLGVSAGTGAAPFRMLTAADVLYLKAELAAKGKIADDAKVILQSAVEASFAQVDAVTAVAGMGTEPELVGSDAVNTYIGKVLGEYDASSAEKKLEIIMTQKWISKFGSSNDAYTDYRRTGYPVLFDPNTMGALATGGPEGSGQVPVQCTRPYPLSLPWSSDELSMNDNAPDQKSVGSAPIFWDK